MARLRLNVTLAALSSLPGVVWPAEAASLATLEKEFSGPIHATLKQYCLGCHSTEKHKGDLDLERFASLTDIIKQPKVWQRVVEQLSLGEMPPAEKPQLNREQKEQLQRWVDDALDA